MLFISAQPPAIYAPEVYEAEYDVVPEHGIISTKYIQSHEVSCKEGQESYAAVFKITAEEQSTTQKGNAHDPFI
jgi:hypothetical protein